MWDLRVGVIGPGDEFDTDQARVMVTRAFDDIAARYPRKLVTVVAGLANSGMDQIAYEEARGRRWDTAGIACDMLAERDWFPVDEVLDIVPGHWGAERPRFLRSIHVLIRVGVLYTLPAEAEELEQLKTQGRLVVLDYELPARSS
ncbi:hypothetical protein NE236_19910 [Actinoallomurus purpureus]|uniref:hypothetical protein n=1 Tax=Actinoallomurus purpureus TaxID=478114 RepID=UPI002093E3DA|nr:hypothetical protein [Actinoallomurus purpureus]MCO6007250.1 hypothetical protein [Actinoallomurus purpureus]